MDVFVPPYFNKDAHIRMLSRTHIYIPMQRTHAEINTQTYTSNTAIPSKACLSEFNSGLRHAVRRLFFRKKV